MKQAQFDLTTLRQASGLNQTEFWQAVGVTQSGGSRYEAGRQPPKPVIELLRLVYIEKLDLERVRREDIELVEYMRAEERELYDRLRRKSRAWVLKQRR